MRQNILIRATYNIVRQNNKNAIELQNTTLHVNGNEALQIVFYDTSKREDTIFIQKYKK
jgi:hypothetical protein